MASDVIEEVGMDIEKILPPEMRDQWPTLWAALKEVGVDYDALKNQVEGLKLERNVLQKICAQRSDEIERLRSSQASDAEAFDANVNRLKACEHIANGDEGWEKLRNECPSTAAVARLRDRQASAVAGVVEDMVAVLDARIAHLVRCKESAPTGSHKTSNYFFRQLEAEQIRKAILSLIPNKQEGVDEGGRRG